LISVDPSGLALIHPPDICKAKIIKGTSWNRTLQLGEIDGADKDIVDINGEKGLKSSVMWGILSGNHRGIESKEEEEEEEIFPTKTSVFCVCI